MFICYNLSCLKTAERGCWAVSEVLTEVFFFPFPSPRTVSCRCQRSSFQPDVAGGDHLCPGTFARGAAAPAAAQLLGAEQQRQREPRAPGLLRAVGQGSALGRAEPSGQPCRPALLAAAPLRVPGGAAQGGSLPRRRRRRLPLRVQRLRAVSPAPGGPAGGGAGGLGSHPAAPLAPGVPWLLACSGRLRLRPWLDSSRNVLIPAVPLQVHLPVLFCLLSMLSGGVCWQTVRLPRANSPNSSFGGKQWEKSPAVREQSARSYGVTQGVTVDAEAWLCFNSCSHSKG